MISENSPSKPGLSPEMAELIGMPNGSEPSKEQLAHLLSGLRADGEKIAGKTYATYREWTDAQGVKRESTPLGFVDFTFSAPKSFSVAWAMAPTNYERSLLWTRHWIAVLKTMDVIEKDLGIVRSGKGGAVEESGEIAWMAVDHYASRPTVGIPIVENGVPATEIITMKQAGGDMQVHSHVAVFNVTRGADGKVGSLHPATSMARSRSGARSTRRSSGRG